MRGRKRPSSEESHETYFLPAEKVIVAKAETSHIKIQQGLRAVRDNEYRYSKENLPVYMCTGHGMEIPSEFCEGADQRPVCRKIVPDKTYLVTLSDLDTPVMQPQHCELLYNFSLKENQAFFKGLSPREAKNVTKILPEGMNTSDVRTYPPGSQMPTVEYYPVSSTVEDVRTVYVSGIYQLAKVNKRRGGEYTPAQIRECEPFKHDLQTPLTAKIIYDMFKKSVYPTAYQVLNLMAERRREGKPTSIDDVDNTFRATMDVVMRKLGPGIYYFPLCRSCMRPTPYEIYEANISRLPADHPKLVKAFTVGDDRGYDKVMALFGNMAIEQIEDEKKFRLLRQRLREKSMDQQRRVQASPWETKPVPAKKKSEKRKLPPPTRPTEVTYSFPVAGAGRAVDVVDLIEDSDEDEVIIVSHTPSSAAAVMPTPSSAAALPGKRPEVFNVDTDSDSYGGRRYLRH